MKKTIFLALLLISGVSFGQNYQSGDAELDVSLQTINTDANNDLTAFKLNLSNTFNVALPKIEQCFSMGMTAGDAFMACQIANIAQKTMDDVFSFYPTSRSKGWEAVAKELGVKPGSAEFQTLKAKVMEKSGS